MADHDSLTVKIPPVIGVLSVKDVFDELSVTEKLYAHHMARAAWLGTRIILRQVSPESTAIFDFILDLYRVCNGDWGKITAHAGVSAHEMQHFLEYAAVFLGNVGNYYGHGDQKFTPNVSKEFVRRLSSVSTLSPDLDEDTIENTLAQYPRGLGFPSDTSQSSYYPGETRMTREEIFTVSEVLNDLSIEPENTRILKSKDGPRAVYDVLQGSVEEDDPPLEVKRPGFGLVRIVRGDHSKELRQICDCLEEAQKYASSPLQQKYIIELRCSFVSGSIETYKDSQRTWIKDLEPPVESIFGFVEPYRDPFGIRAEFEGLVAIVHKHETKTLRGLAENSAKFIKRLPWAIDSIENEGKGPFEKTSLDAPGFTSLYALAYCSSIIFPGINVPNFNDIRQDTGFKNVMITNSMTDNGSEEHVPIPCIHPSEAERFSEHKPHAYYLWVVFHELLGHGTGKLLMENSNGSFNFDIQNPPINPLTNRPISSWYRPGQTWTGLFKDIATSVDECRAECVGAYLMSDEELLGIFGYTDETKITCKDLVEYNMYMQLGVAGLRALENYTMEDQNWGQAHSR
ncbi:hypothetical protein LTR39_002412, partial [Cryomyces antarcticus]